MNILPILITAFKCATLACALVTIYRLSILFNPEQMKEQMRSYRVIQNTRASKHPKTKITYEETKAFLLSTGICIKLNKKLEPFDYFLLRTIFAIGFFFAALSTLPTFNIHGFSMVLGAVVASVLGFYFLHLYALEIDKKDNEAMLDDIKKLFMTLRIQTKNGVFIDEAFSECYNIVTYPRLKKALLELIVDIQTTGLVSAVSIFDAKFNNELLASLCENIIQGNKTGQLVQVLDSLSTQIDAIDEALLLRAEQKLKNKTAMFSVVLFIGIVAIAMFVAFTGIDISGLF